MAELVLAWVFLLFTCAVIMSRRDGSGSLVLAYFIGLSLIHVPGAITFIGDAPGVGGRQETAVGFAATIVGLAAFTVGAILGRSRRPMPHLSEFGSKRSTTFDRSGRLALLLGLVIYFGIMPVSSFIPSAASLLSPLGGLIIVGCWVIIFSASRRGDWRKQMVMLFALPLLPIATLLTGGFIGFGIYWIIAILSFMFAIAKRRWAYYLSGPLIVYLGLSLGVAYLHERGGIRGLVAAGDSGYGERIEQAFSIIDAFEFYSINNPSHVVVVDLRLNQNWFVGRAIQRYESGLYDLAYGSTVPIWAFIPRAIWPGKPEVGGGGNVLSFYADFPVSQNVSFGAGQPLEFFVNFGWQGVIFGFLLLGYTLSRLGVRVCRSLQAENMKGVLTSGLPALVLLQPGGNLLEIVVGLVGAYIAARGVSYVFLRFGGALPAGNISHSTTPTFIASRDNANVSVVLDNVSSRHIRYRFRQ